MYILKRFWSTVWALILMSAVAGCVGSVEKSYSCGVDVLNLRAGSEIHLVGDLLPKQNPVVYLRYYDSIDAILVISEFGKCVGKIDMLTNDVHQYERLIGVSAAINFYDIERSDFASFIRDQYDKCERDSEAYIALAPYGTRLKNREKNTFSATHPEEQASACGIFIPDNSYVANVLDGDDMVTVDIFGNKVFVARKKWQ